MKSADAHTRIAENFRSVTTASRPACIKKTRRTPGRRKGGEGEGEGHREKNIPGVGHRQLDLAFPIYALVDAINLHLRAAAPLAAASSLQGEEGGRRAQERGREKAGKSSRYLVDIARATVTTTLARNRNTCGKPV